MRPRVWIPALLGLFGAARWLRRRRDSNSLLLAPDPAEELRAKLADARAAAGDREAFEAGETAVDEADVPVDERRRSVHDAGRSAIDEMRDR